MIYFTSDLHLGHSGIIKLCSRPFSCVEEMDETLISNWNKKVKKNDTVYVVGDFIWGSADVEKYLTRLSGKKILIVGNHDKWAKKEEYGKFFEYVTKYEEVSLNGHQITLCHYPMVEWKNSRKEGTSKLGYLIFGHIHNNVKPHYELLFKYDNALNAGVDVNNFMPVTFDELIQNNSEFSKKALTRIMEIKSKL